MPTGYTAKLMETGEPFHAFALRCARAFGALIEMRDEPMDAPIPEFKPSAYYTSHRAEVCAQLDLLHAMTEAEQIAHGQKTKEQEIDRHEKWLAKEIAENHRLMQMRGQVEAWEPPSSDHFELAAFMLQQIDSSLQDTHYIERMIAEAREKTPITFFVEAEQSASRMLASLEDGSHKDRERTDSRNQWVRQLRESLGSQVAVS